MEKFKNVIKKIKSFFILVIRKIKFLLKLTKFDNDLFKLGVDEVEKLILKNVVSNIPETVYELKILISQTIKTKFKNVPVVSNVLNDVLDFATRNIKQDISILNKKNITKYVKELATNMKNWYDKNL